MATGYQTNDAFTLAYIDDALALATAGDEAGAFLAANNLIRGSLSPHRVSLSDHDKDRFWLQIGQLLQAYYLASYVTVENGQLGQIAQIETLAAINVAEAWRRANLLNPALTERDRARLGTRIAAIANIPPTPAVPTFILLRDGLSKILLGNVSGKLQLAAH